MCGTRFLKLDAGVTQFAAPRKSKQMTNARETARKRKDRRLDRHATDGLIRRQRLDKLVNRHATDRVDIVRGHVPQRK